MQVIGAADGRMAPAGAEPTERERLALYDTMFAYAGTYTLRGAQVIHHVDISWNQTWTGTDQARIVDLRGPVLILTTDFTDPVSGAVTHYAVTWEKVD
jgi:hypothetical protein